MNDDLSESNRDKPFIFESDCKMNKSKKKYAYIKMPKTPNNTFSKLKL